MSQNDWLIYAIYASKFNKESLRGLKYDLTLPELLDLKEFIDCHEAMELAQHKDHEAASKSQG